MTTNLALSAENERLRNLQKSLKDQVSRLLTEKDDLFEHVEPYLNALYLDKIGSLQYEAYVIKTEIAKLKMEINLIQRYINQNKSICFDDINQELEAAAKEYRKMIELEAEKIRKARELLQMTTLTNAECVEIKRLYHAIVKRLHPDLNPQQTEQEKRWLWRAQQAYAINDLDEMRALSVIIENMENDKTDDRQDNELEKEVAHLRETVDKLLKDIEQIQERFPFNQREFLFDNRKVEAKREELKSEIEQKKKERNELQQYVNSLRLWKPGLLN